MTQRSIAAMLGVRRVGVTRAAVEFQAAGLMSYRRAHIRILNETGLEKQTCECYRFMRLQFDGLLKDVPGFLSGKSLISDKRPRSG